MSTLPPAAQGKSWWRSKSSKDLPSLRSRRSTTNLKQDDGSSLNGSTKQKESSSSGSRFNTLVATAMGKKPKKPTLTIQDPPEPMPRRRAPSNAGTSTPQTTPLPTHNFAGRPPIRSVYSETSDPHTISEPRTPSDHPRDRSSFQNSIMTFSDPDPFAAGSIILSPFPQDPNRLSVYSDNSMLDPSSKRGDPSRHISYSSFSTSSHGHPSTSSQTARSQAHSPIAADGRTQQFRPPSERSIHEGGQRGASGFMPNDVAPLRPVDPPPSSRIMPHDLTSRESNRARSTTSAANRDELYTRSNPPTLRARGRTIGGTADKRPNTATGSVGYATVNGHARIPPAELQRSPSDYFSMTRSPSSATSPITFSRSRASSTNRSDAAISPVSTSTRPLVLVRKASSSRVTVPPPSAAPPTAELPPPPVSPFLAPSFTDSAEDLSDLVFPDPPSSNASSLSFTSKTHMGSSSLSGDAILHLMRDGYGDMGDDFGASSQLSPPATLRDINMDPTPPSSAKFPGSAVGGRAFSPSSDSSHLASPRNLKKAVSQQHLPAAVTPPIRDDSLPANAVYTSPGGSAPRKQRSFHHPRLPLPPLPNLRHASSYSSASANTDVIPSTSASPAPEQRKPGVSSPVSTRKRLFSNSSTRRSISSQAPASPSLPSPSNEDDIRSLFSLDGTETSSRASFTQERRQKQPVVMSFTNFGNHFSLVTENACIASNWDDIPPDGASMNNKRVSQSEYVPQHIMSPAEMLKLEEEFADEVVLPPMEDLDLSEVKGTPKLELELADLGLSRVPQGSRPRADSVLSNVSTGTLAFGHADRGVMGEVSVHGTPHHPGPSSRPRRPSTANELSSPGASLTQSPMRGGSVLGRDGHGLSKSSSSGRRPSTTQAITTTTTSSSSAYTTESPEQRSTALPPPPRPRALREQQQPRSSSGRDNRASVIPIHPLSPPPRQRTRSGRTTASVSEREERHRHPPSAFGPPKIDNRKSLMKKPSFLDIEDEADADLDMGDLMEMEMDASGSPPIRSSFLDLDRSSFDAGQSSDEESYVF